MNVISVSTKAETLLCDDRIVLLQYQNKLLSNQAKEIMPAVLPINRTNLPLDGPHMETVTQSIHLSTKDLQTTHIK